MATYKRCNGPTPSGGAYSDIYYFNDNGESADEAVATKCVIRECAADGSLLCETWGICCKTT